MSGCEVMEPGEGGWTEWVHPEPGFLMECCDCGLIHEMDFAVAVPVEEFPDGTFTWERISQRVVKVMMRARRADAEAVANKLAGYEAEGRMNQDRSLT